MAKIYGNLERASLEVLSSAPTVGVTGRVYWDSTDLKAKIDNSVAFRAFLVNDTKCILGNSATANDNIRLNRAAVSVLQFVRGGDTTAEGSLSTDLAQLSFKFESYATGSLPAAGVGGRIVYDTTTNQFKRDNASALNALATIDGTETFTNKTLTGNIAVNLVSGAATVTLPTTTGTLATLANTETFTNKTFGDAIIGTQISTPSNPSAGTNKLYFKSNQRLYSLDSSGVETQVDAGSSYAFIVSAYFVTTSGATVSTTSGSLASFGTTAAWPGPTIEFEGSGSWSTQTTDADKPQLTINSLPAGTYKVMCTGMGYASAGNNNLSLHDGTSYSGSGSVTPASGNTSEFCVIGVFQYGASGNRTFELRGQTSAGTLTVDNDNGGVSTKFIVEKMI